MIVLLFAGAWCWCRMTQRPELTRRCFMIPVCTSTRAWYCTGPHLLFLAGVGLFYARARKDGFLYDTTTRTLTNECSKLRSTSTAVPLLDKERVACSRALGTLELQFCFRLRAVK